MDRICIKEAFYVPKLQVKFLLSKFASSRLKVQFNLKEYIVKVLDGEAIAIASHEANLYQINHAMVQEADMANLMQLPRIDVKLKIWRCRIGYLNAKNINMLQSIVSGMNLGKVLSSHILVIV